MKRILPLLVVLLFFSVTSMGQNVRFGLTGSPQFDFARILPNNVESGGVRLGFSYGLLIDLRIDNNERYAFATGLLHTLTGLNLDVNYSDTAGTVIRTDQRTLKIQYIEIPLTMRLRTNEIGYMTYYGQIGLIPGIRVSSRLDQESNAADPSLTFENQKTKDIGFLNLALQIGAGVEYSVSSSTHLVGGLYYNNGFTNVYDGDNVNDKISLRNLGIRLGVLF